MSSLLREAELSLVGATAFFTRENTKIENPWIWETSQWVRCLLYIHEYWILSPGNVVAHL